MVTVKGPEVSPQRFLLGSKVLHIVFRHYIQKANYVKRSYNEPRYVLNVGF